MILYRIIFYAKISIRNLNTILQPDINFISITDFAICELHDFRAVDLKKILNDCDLMI